MSGEILVLVVFVLGVAAIGGKLAFDMYLGEGRKGSAKSIVPARERMKAYYSSKGAND
jgi:hypothetical protein